MTEADEFLTHMVPTDTTQALEFIRNNPEFDGRGVKVAVLDTGVDPAASGLQITTEGLPKITDIRDFTGDGDVKLLKQVEAHVIQATGEQETKAFAILKGLHDQDLILSKEQFEMNKRNIWWIGEKDIYSYFPSTVVNRLKSEFNKKSKAYNNLLIENTQQKLKEIPKTEENRIAELTNQISALENSGNGASKSFLSTSDPGVMANCVVFLDNDDVFRAIIDKEGTGDMTNSRALASYHVNREFDKWERLSYCVNISKSAKFDIEAAIPDLTQLKLSLVCDGGNHGTHVASILAGNHPEKPELNGVAPGAEIISLKIGDGRLHGGSMESGKSIIRAVSYAVQSGCDIANMSFGEASYSCLSGAVIECITEAIHKHGLIFVTSAGNSGPTLSTVGAPGCSASSLFITVGAFISSEMRRAQYNFITELEKADFKETSQTLYDFSSRGPTYSGGAGVTICAPGGAIASVSSWSNLKKKQMHGTSMSSPNACGCITLVLSGLKASDTIFSPCRLKRSIQNSAIPIEGTASHGLGVGSGLIQVMSCFEMIMKELKASNQNPSLFHLDLPIQFNITGGKGITGGCNDDMEGIYLRTAVAVDATSTHTVTINPMWNDEEQYANNTEGYAFSYAMDSKRGEGCRRGGNIITRFSKTLKAKLSLNLKFRTNAPWVKVPDNVLFHGSEKFKIIVDPKGLAPGLHFTWVEVYESEFSAVVGEELPFVKIPVTVIKPHNINTVTTNPETDFIAERMKFKPGSIERIFLSVPAGATWVDLKVTNVGGMNATEEQPFKQNDSSSKLFFLTCFQMTPNGSYRYDQNDNYSWLSNQKGSETIASERVYAPGIIELCLCQSWRFRGIGEYTLEAKFQGVQCSQNEVFFSAEESMTAKIRVTNLIRNIALSPSLRFDAYHRHVVPSNSTLSVDWDFDRLPYEYQTEYLGVDKSGITRSKSKAHGRATLKGFYKTIMKGKKTDKNTPGMGEMRTRMYQLMLQYELDLEQAASVTLSLGPIHNLLYDGLFSCHMLMVFSETKELLHVGDSFAKPMRLSAGKSTVRVCLCHTDQGFLKRFQRAKLKCSYSTTVPVHVGMSDNRIDLAAGRGRHAIGLGLGDSRNLWLSLSQVRWPPMMRPGDVLSGTLTLESQNGKSWGAKSCPKGMKASVVASLDFGEFPNHSSEPRVAPVPIAFPQVNSVLERLEKGTLKFATDGALVAEVNRFSILLDQAGNGSAPVVANMKARFDAYMLTRQMLRYIGKDMAKLEASAQAMLTKYKSKPRHSPTEAFIVSAALYCVGYKQLGEQDKTKAVENAKKTSEEMQAFLTQRGLAYQLLLGVGIATVKGDSATALSQLMVLLITPNHILDSCGISKLALWKEQGRLLEKLDWLHLHRFQKNRMRLKYPASYASF